MFIHYRHSTRRFMLTPTFRYKRIQTSVSIDKGALYRTMLAVASAPDEASFFDRYARAKVGKA